MKRFNNGFVTLIGILLTMVIICILSYTAFKVYFKGSPQRKGIVDTFSEQGLDTANYQSVLDSSRKEIERANKKVIDRAKQLEELYD